MLPTTECAAAMKISILDDYHDTLRTLDCFTKLSGCMFRGRLVIRCCVLLPT